MPPKSQPGEGIVIVVDVGPGVRASTENTFYSQSKSCLINILQRKIFAEKSKDMVGIVLFNTDETKNKLAKDDEYQHVTVYSTPKFVDWDMILKARNLPRGNSSGDWLDAVIVAMDLLYDPDGIMYGSKKIVLMTDFNGEFSDDQTETIIEGVKSMGIELSVIGPSLDDDDDDNEDTAGPSSAKNSKSKSAPTNWNGKPKSQRQLAAESLIKRIIAEVDGIICSFEEAIPQLLFFEKKAQRSANWNSILDIGQNFKIPVVGRIKIRRATIPTWKKVYMEDENAVVISETSFHKKDENQTVVEKEDVISGFRYGTTLVPFGEEDAMLKYSCESPGAALSVLGFTRSSFVPMTMRVGDQVLVVTAKDGDEEGAIALSSIIQALKELDMDGHYAKGVSKKL
ncbi:X-ray repair cross-complementing protein 5 [Armadillidium vulgare]|nr:X-ray repair cross-complementing protein 5 [Armadillidium vulgare]